MYNWSERCINARLKVQISNACWMHCFHLRQALVAETLPKGYSQILNILLYIVHSTKGKALLTGLFLIICDDMRALYGNFPYQSKVSWLSKGKLLTNVMELRGDYYIFSKPSQITFKLFSIQNWIFFLTYLSK